MKRKRKFQDLFGCFLFAFLLKLRILLQNIKTLEEGRFVAAARQLFICSVSHYIFILCFMLQEFTFACIFIHYNKLEHLKKSQVWGMMVNQMKD